MQTPEFSSIVEEHAKYIHELRNEFPTRQQRRAEERRRQKEASKQKIKPNRKITF